jgi:hypothetical protein
MNRLENTYAAFPPFIHWDSSLMSRTEISDNDVFLRLNIRLQMLEHRLLLERLAYKQGLLDGQSMVNCAREMLELTVLIWVQRDRFVEHHQDYDVGLHSHRLLVSLTPPSGCSCAGVSHPPGFSASSSSNK